jgi:hypothetical protein
VHNTFTPEGVNYFDQGETIPDNLFGLDCAGGGQCDELGGDIWLTLVRAAYGVPVQFFYSWDDEQT